MKYGLFLCALFSFSIGYGQVDLPAQTTTPFKTDLLDTIIALVIILFILSVINEKITQLIRKYSPFIRPHHKLSKTRIGSIWKNIRKRQKDDTILDDKIEREVTSLSFFVGLAITVIFCVDLFKMFTADDLRTSLYWTQGKWGYYWSEGEWYHRVPILIVSFCLTAFFLTFGSKFFHDLLDTLFQAKNLKRKLADSRTFEDPQSILEFEEFVKTPESKLSQLAVAQQSSTILETKGVLSVGTGYMNIEGEKVGCLEIHVTDESVIAALRKEYTIRLSSGLDVKVPSNFIVTGDYPRTFLGAGGKIANATQKLGFGTFGGIVRDIVTKEKYILSCHHVLNGEINWKGLSDSREIVALENDQLLPVAELSFGFRTHEFDTALARITPGSTLTNQAIGNPKSIRKVGSSDAINEVQVSILGGETNRRMTGFVFNDSWDTKFHYPAPGGNTELWPLHDLVVLSSLQVSELKSLTQGGDSGAFVIDKDNHVIGVVVGGDAKFTYAIKMDKIAATFNIELI